MRYWYTYGILSIIVCLSGVMVPQVHAQTLPVSGASLSVTPQYPQPGEEVRITASSLRVDTDTATIEWYKNGELVRSGVGENRFVFTAEQDDTATTIQVVLIGQDDTTVGATTTIQPAHVAITWEANTYTPPLYVGTPLQGPGASVTIHAVPLVRTQEGARIRKEDLLFEWANRTDNKTLQRGVGLDTVTLTNPDPFLDFDIVLRIFTLNGSQRALRTITIPTEKPELVLYPKHVLRGINWHKPLRRDYSLDSELSEIVAEPFFYSTGSRYDTNLSYEWNVGGQYIETPGSIVLSPEGEGIGRSHISLSVAHKNAWRQRADTSATVTFDTTRTGNAPATTQPF
jgi:hypothetical protein